MYWDWVLRDYLIQQFRIILVLKGNTYPHLKRAHMDKFFQIGHSNSYYPAVIFKEDCSLSHLGYVVWELQDFKGYFRCCGSKL